MPNRERYILEHAVHAIAEHAAKADDLVEEAIGVGRLALSGDAVVSGSHASG